MPESYIEMQQRHDRLDQLEYQQEYYARWAGSPDYLEVTDPDPATVQDCSTCRYTENGPENHLCDTYRKLIPGPIGCSGWSRNPIHPT